MEPDSSPDAPLTLTHARLRAAQGDLAAARRILRALLDVDAGNSDALALLSALGVDRAGDLPRLEGSGGAREPSIALRDWLDTIQKTRGKRRDAR